MQPHALGDCSAHHSFSTLQLVFQHIESLASPGTTIRYRRDPQDRTAMGADPGTPEHDTASAAASAGTAALATSQDQLAPVHTNGSLTPTAQGDQSREQGKQGPSIQSPASALADLLSTLELATPAPAAKPAAAEAAEPAHAADAQTTSKEAAAVPAAERPEAARPGDVTVGLCYDPVMEQHVGPPSHVERPQRTAVLVKRLQQAGLAARCWKLPSRQATDAELRRAHTEAHIKFVSTPPRTDDWRLGDNFFSPATPLACRLAAGCTVQAVEAVCSGTVERAFAVVRPPGHHAECARAMGFCFFNNVAVGALHAHALGEKRVLVLDWDVHHGNGIEEILYGNPDIMYISLHRGNGFYPGTGDVCDVGERAGRGFNLNIPFPRGGFTDADYVAAFDLVLEPVIAGFAPDLILVSAGYDAVQGDPLGGMSLTPEVFGHLTQRLIRLARAGRLVLALEGGYNLRQTAECAAECAKVLLGEAPTPLDSAAPWKPAQDTRELLAAVAAAQAPFWPVLAPLATAEGFQARWDGYLLGKQTEASLHVRRSPRAPKPAAK